MASHAVTRSAQDPAGVAIEDHLAALAAHLIGPRRARATVLEELRDGLHEAATSYAARGLSPRAAAWAAVAEFGTPGEVGAAFAHELGTRQARRSIITLLLTGPLVGVWWLLLLAPQPWPFTPRGLWTAIPALPLVAVGAVTGLGVLAATGGLTQWLPAARPQQALAGASAVALACLAGDLTVLATMATRQTLPAALATIAASASFVRLACCARVLRHCRRSFALLVAGA